MNGRCDRCGQTGLIISRITAEGWFNYRQICIDCWAAVLKWIDDCANRRPIQVAKDEAARLTPRVRLRCSVCQAEHWGVVEEIGKTCGRTPPRDQLWGGLCRGVLESNTVTWSFDVPQAFEGLSACCPECGMAVLRPQGARGTPTEERFWVQCNSGHGFLAQFWRRQ